MIPLVETDNQYVQTAVTQVLEGLRLLNDDNGEPLASHHQDFLYPPPATLPAFIAHQAGIQLPQTAPAQRRGAPKYEQDIAVGIRYLIGEATAGYHGRLQQRLWVDQVRILNYVNAQQNLVFKPSHIIIRELAPSGVFMSGVTRLGVFQDMPNHIGVDFLLQLKFTVNVQLKR